MDVKILLVRDPVVEEALQRYIQQRQEEQRMRSTGSTHCFVCGDTKIASIRLAPRRYKKQAELYKNFILDDESLKIEISPQLYSQVEDAENNGSCAKCLSEIKEVWDIHKQITSLEQDMNQMVKSARQKIKLRSVDVKAENAMNEEDYFMDIMDSSDGCDNYEEVNKDNINTGSIVKLRDVKSNTKYALRPYIIRPQKDIENQEEENTDRNVSNPDQAAIDIDYEEDGNHNSTDEDESDDYSLEKKSNRKSSSSSKKVENKKKYPCIKCGKELTRQSLRLMHQVTVCGMQVDQKELDKYNIKFHECCNYKFGKKRDFERHKLTHSSSERVRKHITKKFPCLKCGKELTRQSLRLMHQVTVCGMQLDQKELEKYKITFYDCCNRKFASKRDFERHKSTHNRLKIYPCSKCGAKFTQKYSAISHEKTVCGTEEDKRKFRESRRLTKQAFKNKPLSKCPKCPSRFLHEKNLTKHLATSHPEDTTLLNVICDHCGVSLAKRSLEGHIKRVHNQEKHHFCKYCNKGFYITSDLLKHVSRIHCPPASKPPPLLCTICGQSCCDLRSMKRHTAQVHQREKNFTCITCDWKFYSNSDLSKHIKTHNRQMHHCDKCGRDYQRISTFENHKKNFPNCDRNKARLERQLKSLSDSLIRRKETCVSCRKDFPSKGFMDKHIRDNHPDLWDFAKKRRINPQDKEDCNSVEDEESIPAFNYEVELI